MAKACLASLESTHSPGPGVELIVSGDLIVPLDSFGEAIDCLKQCFAAFGLPGIHSTSRLQILHAITGLIRVACLERFVSSAEECRFPEFPGERRVPWNRNIRRNRAAKARFVCDHRAHFAG